MSDPLTLTVELSPAQLEAIAQRVAALMTPAVAEWVDAEGAALLLGYSDGDVKRGKARVYDLAASGKLETAKDGRRLLVRRSSIDRYLVEQS